MTLRASLPPREGEAELPGLGAPVRVSFDALGIPTLEAATRPDLARAIRDYARQQQWANLDAEVLACCETTSERISTNRLDALLNSDVDAITTLALIATPQRLIWAHSGERAARHLGSIQGYAPQNSRPNTRRISPWNMATWTARARKRAGSHASPGPTAQKFCEIMRAPTTYPPKSKSRAASGWEMAVSCRRWVS
jgi:hypothetical protein